MDTGHFTIRDIGSSWTSTTVTHNLKHQDKKIRVITSHPMANNRKK